MSGVIRQECEEYKKSEDNSLSLWDAMPTIGGGVLMAAAALNWVVQEYRNHPQHDHHGGGADAKGLGCSICTVFLGESCEFCSH